MIEGDTRLFVPENLIFVAVGLFVPGVTRVLSFRGIRAMGSSVTSTIVNTTPMFSTVLAMIVLGERPAPLVLIGVLLTVGGLVTVSWGGEKTSYHKIELIFPFLCALLFSMKDIAVRWGLAGGGGQPILAAAIAAVTSTVEIFLLTRYGQQQIHVAAASGCPLVCWVRCLYRRLVFVHVRCLQHGAGVDRRAPGQ
jgi:drug/metabolite transporter (DMT)-like permease